MILEIDIGERLSVVIVDNKTGGLFFERGPLGVMLPWSDRALVRT
jgi:hypothetical protein